MEAENNEKHSALKSALDTLKELKVPEHLQATVLNYLLSSAPLPSSGRKNVSNTSHSAADFAHSGGDLRSFITAAAPKGAVSEIPALLFWAKENEDKQTANEKDVIELYRRAGIRPPKDVLQSFRDLCSKKYMRLESVEGERGVVRLARAGEDFVLHDLLSK